MGARMRDQLLIQYARELRAHQTDAEQRLWYLLRRKHLGCRFRRQYPIGPYIADFATLRPRLVIELDGGQHVLQHHYDEARDDSMRAHGFVVLRFWSNEVLQNTAGVLEVIRKTIQAQSPPPSCPSPASAGEGT